MALSDDAFIIRGGIMEIMTLRVAIDTCKVRHHFYGLSFFGDDGLTVEEIAQYAKRDNRRIRVSRVGRLREIGLEPYHRWTYPHITVEFEIYLSDEELERLVGVFDPDIPNPYKAG